jgi:RimJ/RimL family protein N-acetyltransferase
VLKLRPAAQSDAALLRAWRNDPVTRAASRNTDAVGEAEHEVWLARTLADPGQRLLVAEADGRPAGQVRLERGADSWEISVALAPERRGTGLGAALIQAGVEQLAAEGTEGQMEAWIRVGNEPSMRAFERAGFSEDPGRSNDEYRLLTRAISL